MKTLEYLPLYVSVFALQFVTIVAIAIERIPKGLRFAFILGWGVLLAGTLAFGYSFRRRTVAMRQIVQILPLAVMVAILYLWIAAVGPRIVYLIFGLGLLAGRNALLATRRALYLDLAIVLAAFYDTIGAPDTNYLWPIVVVFLATLMFVLMADYADRRLAYVGASDKEARESLAPGLRNAVLATVLVLAVGALIYLLLPQPAARHLGLPDPDARNFSDYGAGRPRPAAPDPKGDKKGLLSDPKGSRQAPAGRGDLARLDISRGGGGGKDPVPSRQQPDKQGTPGGGGGPGEGNASRGKEPGEQPGGSKADPRADKEPGKGKPSPEGEPQDQQKDQQKKSDKPKDKQKEKDDKRKDKADDKSDKDKSKDKDKGKDKEKSKDKKKGTPQPLVLAYVDARHGLYARTHVFSQPGNREWLERVERPIVLQSSDGRFVMAGSDDRDALRQSYRINGTLEPRIPAAYRAVRLGFPAWSIGRTPDAVLLAGAELKPGTAFTIVSTVQYIQSRPTGSVEPQPARFYLELPEGSGRVAELAASAARAAATQAERAAALEAFLRRDYKYGAFEAGDDDPAESFLFVQRRGGAEQFAAALALMMRTAGIPARVAGGHRVRRLNPLHGDYEIWAADRHYWVEAYVDDRWTMYEPSPWAAPPPNQAPASTWAAAKNYVELAKHTDWGEEVLPPRRPGDAYLLQVLAWGWIVTFGPWVLVGLVAAAFVGLRFQRVLRPFLDGLDLLRLRRQGDPRWRVLTGYKIVERAFLRRRLARAAAENHVEYLARLATHRPHLGHPLGAMSRSYSAARYGQAAVDPAAAEQAVRACREILELIDESPQPA